MQSASIESRKASKIISKENLYQVKDWVDVLDQDNVWRLARIKKDVEGLFTVSFDGWSDKFNMVKSFSI